MEGESPQEFGHCFLKITQPFELFIADVQMTE